MEVKMSKVINYYVRFTKASVFLQRDQHFGQEEMPLKTFHFHFLILRQRELKTKNKWIRFNQVNKQTNKQNNKQPRIVQGWGMII